jgi:hypothetical protein
MGGGWIFCSQSGLASSRFELSFFEFLLALDAMAGPRNGFQPLGVDLFAAGYAFSERTFADAAKSGFHHLE